MTYEEMMGQSTPTTTATPGLSPSPKKMSFEDMAGNAPQETPQQPAAPVTHSGTPAMDQALGTAGQIYKFMSMSNPMLWPGYAIGQTAAARATLANAAQKAIGSIKPIAAGFVRTAGMRFGVHPGENALMPMEPGQNYDQLRKQQDKVLREDPFFSATQQAPEVAKRLFPIPPGLEDKWYTQVGGAAGGFAPVLASGPFAPFTIGMETIGDKTEKIYDDNIKRGMSPDAAAKDSFDRAIAAGATQAALWQVLPKPLHSAFDKYVIDKVGVSGYKRFVLDRAVNAAEGATLGAATQIPTNIAAGDPAMQDVGQTAAGLGVAQAFFPRGPTHLEHTKEQAGRQEILNKVNSFLARNAPSEGEIQGPPIPKPYTEKYAPRPGEETGAPVDQATGKPLPMILDADLPTDLKQQVRAGKIIEFTDDAGQTTYYDAKGVTDASGKPSTTGVPSTQVRPGVDEKAPLRQPGETPGETPPGEEPKPGAEAVAGEPPKATEQQIEGWKTRRDEAQHEIDLLREGEQTPIIKGHIEDRQNEMVHLNKQIAGELPPDALPPLPKSSESVAEGRIETMSATPEDRARREKDLKEAEAGGKLPGLSAAEESRLAELQQKKIRFDNASGPALSAREWEELVNLKAKQPDAISAAMGMPSVTDMLDEAKYGKLTPEQKNMLLALRRSLKVGGITREQYDSEINKLVSDRPLPEGDIEGEFKKLRTLEDVDADIAALNKQGKLSTPELVAERRQLLDQQDNQPPQPKVEPPPPEQKTPEEQSRDEAAAARVDPAKKIEGYNGPPDPNLPRPKVPVPNETPEHAKQVEQLRFRADAIQNQLSKRRGLPLNNEDAHRTADLRDLWRQIHKIRRESGVRRKVGVVGWGAFGLTVADHMPYEGPDIVIIGKGRIGGPASTSQEILNVGAGGGSGIKGRELFGSKEATARNLGAEFVRGDVVDIRYANGKNGQDGLDIYLGERGADGKVTSINEVIPVWRIAMAPGARQQMMLEGPHSYPFLKDAGWGDASNLARASKDGKTVMTYGAGNAATQGIIGAIDQVGVPGAKKVFVVSRGPFKGEASDNQIRRLNELEREGKVEYIQGPITDAVKQPDGKWIVDIHTKNGTKKFEVDHIENFLASTYNTDWLPPEIEVIPFESPVKDPRTGKQLIDPDTKEPVFQNVPLSLKPGLVKVLNAGRQSTMEGVYVGGDARAGIDPHEEPPRRIDRATGDGSNVAASIHTDLAYLDLYGRLREWNPAIKERVAETDQRIKELLGFHPEEPSPVIGPKTTTTRPSGPTETQPTKNLPGSESATPSQTKTSTTTSPEKTHDELYAEKNEAFKELRALKDLPEHDPRVVAASEKYEKARDTYRSSLKPEAPPKQTSHEARGEIEAAVKTKAQILADEQAAARKKRIRYGEAGTTLFQPTQTQGQGDQKRGFTGTLGPPRPAAEGAPGAPSRAPLLEKPTAKEPAVAPPSTKSFGPLADQYTKSGGTEAVIAKDLFDRTNPDREANIAREFDMNTVTPRQADVAAKQIYDFSQKNLKDVRKLPEQVTVYRAGPISDDVVGVTLDRKVAQRNMDRHGDPVTEYTVPRKEVLADLQAIRPDGFQENELLVHPEHLRKAAVQPMMEQTERAQRAAESVANARMAENPLYSDQLISDLATDKKTAMDGADEQVMVKTRAKFNTARDVAGRKALDKSATKEERAAAATNFEQLDNHIRQMDRATDDGERFRNKKENLAWHSFRQKDYEFPAMEQRLTIAKHGAPLTPQETAKLHHDTNALSNAMVDVENAKRRTGWHPGLGANVAPGLRHLQYVAKQAKDKLDNQVFAANFKSSGALHKTGAVAREITSIPRAIMASMDLSAVRRQGGLFFMSHPLRSIAAMPDMIRAARSDEAYFKLMQDIRERPNADLYRSSKLGLTDIKSPKLSDLEEQYMSQWADKIPLVNNSQRAYVYFLNRLRADTFDAMAATLGKHGIVTEKQAEGLSNFINVFTGRGNVGSHGQALALLNQLFFAPRYTLSRFQALTLQPLIHAKDPRVRLMIAQEYARSLIGFGIMYGLVSTTLKQFGVSTEFDPRSSDFGKIRIGDTRIDPMSGLSQSIVFLTRLITGTTKTAGGKIVPLAGPRQPFSERNISNVLFDFGRSKLAPIPSALLNARIGKKVTGEPTSVPKELLDMVTPMSPNDMFKAMRQYGIPAGVAVGLITMFGDSVQTYSPRVSQAHKRKLHRGR